ncbi:PD-(D/E)XK nuclease family protein [Oleiharenicola lentus]|uniref:PD-(D/E)XK nuclease family protein n=1 Tax=Oleiharenicola lentus TaxID=2508720 RepID=UPI003F681456
MPPANVRRHFLSWEHPLLPQAVEFLAMGWKGDRPLDLSHLLVVVSTSQAGRRLREGLAAHAAKYQQAVFAPRVLTPEVLITAQDAAKIASRLETTLAWIDVLLDVELEAFREVFPVDPPARNFAWALRLTQQFVKLQVTLAEGGLRMVDVAEKAGKFVESARWRQLGALEQLHAEKLAESGLVNSATANIAAARSPAVPEGVDKIILLATPDPLPLALQVVAGVAETIPVEIVVFAPESEAENFNDWGLPRVETWEHRVFDLPRFAEHVHLCADPVAQAERIAKVARAYGQPEGLLAVGSVDAEVLPPLETALRAKNLPSYNPEGRAQKQAGFYQLLLALASLEKEATFESVETLARCPDFCASLRTRLGAEFSTAHWLDGLDDLRERHLPATLAAAREHAKLSKRPNLKLIAALEVVDEVRALLRRGDFATSVSNVLSLIFSTRTLEPGRETDGDLEEAISAWMDAVRACAEASGRFARLKRGDWWELALKTFGDTQLTSEKTAGAVELQGWLELLWEDAPHLMVAGFNDGRVPEAVAGDAFLPESLRERLGLKTNAARLVRDAYILQAMTSSRRESGRLDVLFGKTSVSGDPIRPSRLLLRCADAELPERVNFLFREPELAGQNVPWARAWKLAPRQADSPKRVSVTALRGWLKCPLRFYFRTVLEMEAVDPVKSELDARDFGTLCHSALEAMGKDEAMRDSQDEAALREFLTTHFDQEVRRRFGVELTLPLLVQVESARQRLSKAAAVQAQERAAGWVIEEVERKFELPVGEVIVAGKIDRIERNQLTGAVRVLDYKTSDSAVAPIKVHLDKPDEKTPEWALFQLNRKEVAWTDLQLPVYLEALAAAGFGREVTCGYFNLPKAAGETGLELWEAYSPELRDAAWRCVQGVCAAIGAGEFWPPRELKGWDAELDDFASLFHHGAAASIVWKEAKS